MTQESIEWKCVFAAGANIGEEPVWAAGNLLYWVDIFAPSLNCLDLTSGTSKSWHMPDLIGTYALLPSGRGAVVALRSGLFKLDFGSGALTQLNAAPYDTKHYRYNDGRCDRAGRFWVGTMRLPSADLPDGGGAFYRYDARGLAVGVTGVTIANGLAWSPDNKTMYIADRPNWQILAFDYDIETGVASNRRRFTRIPEGEHPDGATVDSEGGYWIAMYAAGKIRRFLPDGSFDRELRAPTSHPTMICFGGEDYRTLFVTTSSHHLSPEQRKEDARAGAIYSCSDLGVRGLPEPPIGFAI